MTYFKILLDKPHFFAVPLPHRSLTILIKKGRGIGPVKP